MPHVSSDGVGDDLCSSDEIKVFKDEGENKNSSENLNELIEDQNDLIDLSESEVSLVSLVFYISCICGEQILQGVGVSMLWVISS